MFAVAIKTEVALAGFALNYDPLIFCILLMLFPKLRLHLDRPAEPCTRCPSLLIPNTVLNNLNKSTFSSLDESHFRGAHIDPVVSVDNLGVALGHKHHHGAYP